MDEIEAAIPSFGGDDAVATEEPEEEEINLDMDFSMAKKKKKSKKKDLDENYWISILKITE